MDPLLKKRVWNHLAYELNDSKFLRFGKKSFFKLNIREGGICVSLFTTKKKEIFNLIVRDTHNTINHDERLDRNYIIEIYNFLVKNIKKFHSCSIYRIFMDYDFGSIKPMNLENSKLRTAFEMTKCIICPSCFAAFVFDSDKTIQKIYSLVNTEKDLVLLANRARAISINNDVQSWRLKNYENTSHAFRMINSTYGVSYTPTTYSSATHAYGSRINMNHYQTYIDNMRTTSVDYTVYDAGYRIETVTTGGVSCNSA